jgi:N-formylglutamate amidohydrolase
VKLPFLLSVPHAGIWVPPQVAEYCILNQQEIIEDGDEGARELFRLEDEVESFVTTNVARAIVDMNRADDDWGSDGVVKTHTCWGVPVYREKPPQEAVDKLLDTYYRPYHLQLSDLAKKGVKAGLDCHTMATTGPPIGPDPGCERPLICVSNADGTCPRDWLGSLAMCLGTSFGVHVSLNKPFKGGFIIRRHSGELPWIQVEFSRAPFASIFEKRLRFGQALSRWCELVLP